VEFPENVAGRVAVIDWDFAVLFTASNGKFVPVSCVQVVLSVE
jgi:hypothetical protein